MSTTLVSVIFTESTDSNSNLFCKHPHRNTLEIQFCIYLGGLAAPFLMKLPASVSGKVAKNGPSPWCPTPMCRPTASSWLQASK